LDDATITRMHPFMKTALVSIAIAFAGLFVASTFLPPPPAERERAARYFTEDEIETGLRNAFERRLLFWLSTAYELGFLIALVATGAARRLTDYFAGWTAYCPGAHKLPAVGSRWQRTRAWTTNLLRWLATLLLVGTTYAIAHELLQFPFHIAGFYHSKSMGMTDRPFVDWLGEYALATGVTWLAEAIGGVGLYLLLHWFRRTWYLLGTAGAAGLAFATAFLMPVLVAPLFNTFTPLSQTEWASLEPRIRHLTDKAGIPVSGVFVMDASRQGHHTNAYFTGVGATQSIVLYDTLLKKHPPDEVESILAHEIGHWVHRHIISGILLGTLAALVGLIVLDRMLRWFIGRPPLYLAGLDDPAGLPLVILLGTLGAWAALPLQNAVSRHFERQADAMSLELAGMPKVFIEAEQRLARDNKSNVVPSPWNVWLFATHPPALDRIEMAKQWMGTHKSP
jgi:STE24 endopeptidase